MLSAGDELVYIHEPFSPNARAAPCYPRFTTWFTYITKENEAPYRERIERLATLRYPWGAEVLERRSLRGLLGATRRALQYREARRQGKHPLIKDPVALMSAEWLADTFGMQILILIRHPCAFVASLKRMNWRFSFSNFTSQPSLLRDLLGPFEDEMRRLDAMEHDLIDNGSLIWKVIHHVIYLFEARHQGWIFVRHEDLATSPLEAYQNLYERLKLDWNDRARGTIEKFCYAKIPTPDYGQVLRLVRNSREDAWSWKKVLTTSEIARIRERVEPIASRYYGDETWQVVT